MAYQKIKIPLLKKLLHHSQLLTSIAYSPDGLKIASGSLDFLTNVWDIRTGKLLQQLGGEPFWMSGIYSVAYSPDGLTLVSGRAVKSHLSPGILRWSTESYGMPDEIKGYTDTVSSVAYSPDGLILAGGSWDKTIKLWDVYTGKLLKEFGGYNNPVTSIAYSPDSLVLAGGSRDNTIKLWNTYTGELLKELSGHTDAVTSVVYSPDGLVLVSGSQDTTIKVWDVSSGVLLKELRTHADGVTSLCYSPDGLILASVSRDGMIILWDTCTYVLLKQLNEYRGHAYSIAYSPDGLTLASGYYGTIMLWDLQALKGIPRNNEISYLVSMSHSGMYNSLKEMELVHTINIDSAILLTPEQFETLCFLLPQLPNLSILTLKNCGLTDMNIERLAEVIKIYGRKIINLNLSNNNITYTGAQRLAAGLTGHPALAILDLSENLIGGGDDLLLRLEKTFKQVSLLKTVKIHGNFFDKSCKLFFTLQDPAVKLNALYEYHVFQTQMSEVISLMDSNITISREKWLVGLFCKKRTEHAMIYMERMRKNGQRVFERYHITADDGIVGTAHAYKEAIHHLKSFDPEGYYKKLEPINEVNGRILKDLIKAEIRTQIPLAFSMVSPNSSRGQINCLEWCRQKLAAVDIHIPRSVFGLPSHAAGKKCVIM